MQWCGFKGMSGTALKRLDFLFLFNFVCSSLPFSVVLVSRLALGYKVFLPKLQSRQFMNHYYPTLKAHRVFGVKIFFKGLFEKSVLVLEETELASELNLLLKYSGMVAAYCPNTPDLYYYPFQWHFIVLHRIKWVTYSVQDCGSAWVSLRVFKCSFLWREKKRWLRGEMLAWFSLCLCMPRVLLSRWSGPWWHLNGINYYCGAVGLVDSPLLP